MFGYRPKILEISQTFGTPESASLQRWISHS